MIRHVCIQCSTPLMLDEAFAGGNCRCHKCKTIQRVAAPAEAIATTMAMAEGRLASPNRPQSVVARMKHRRSVVMVAAGAGLLLAAIAPMLLYLMRPTELGASHPSEATIAAKAAESGTTAGPALIGQIPLKGRSIVFLIDRGRASAEATPYFIESSLKAAAILPDGRQFAMVFWDNGSTPLAYPITGMAPAGKTSADVARKSLHDFTAGGSSDALASIPEVLARHPDQIILLTAKASDLPDDFARKLEDLLRKPAGDTTPGPMPIISVLCVGPESPALAHFAESTGGISKSVNPDSLRRLIQQY